MLTITNFYLVCTFVLFYSTFSQHYYLGEGYFKAILTYLNDSNCIFIFFNVIVSLAIIIYRIIAFIFFKQILQGQILKTTDKLKGKLMDLLFLIYVVQLTIDFQMFIVLVAVILSYIIHNLVTFRSQYLIHVHSISGSLELHYRALCLYIILFFLDFEALNFLIGRLFSVDKEVQALFIYYTFTTSMILIDPFVQFFFDFYQKYTFTHIKNSDQRLATISLFLNIPRLILQLLICLWITITFNQWFFALLCLYDNLSSIKKTIQSYQNIKKLSKNLQFLQKIKGDKLGQYHDLTCVVCYEDMQQAILLPCKHIFHEQCIRQWILKNMNHFCPKCKHPLDFKKMQQKHKNEIKQQQQKGLFNKFINKKQPLVNSQTFLKQQQKQILIAKEYFNSQRNSNNNSRIRVQNKNETKNRVKQYIIDHPQLSDFPLEVYQAKKQNIVPIGAIPFGMPVPAVSHRTYLHATKRAEYLDEIQTIMRLIQCERNEQLLLL